MSVPLGLWKPSLATINRSAGRMLRLAGGRHSPPQSQDRTNSWPIYTVPNTHIICLHTHTCRAAFSTEQAKRAINPRSSSNERDGNLILTSAAWQEKWKAAFIPSVAVSHFDKSRHFSFPPWSLEKSSTFHLKHKLIKKKCLQLQISSCQEVGNYSPLQDSLSHL